MPKAVRLTEDQIKTIVYELGQGIRGDDPKDAYDNKLKRIINKLSEG